MERSRVVITECSVGVSEYWSAALRLFHCSTTPLLHYSFLNVSSPWSRVRDLLVARRFERFLFCHLLVRVGRVTRRTTDDEERLAERGIDSEIAHQGGDDTVHIHRQWAADHRFRRLLDLAGELCVRADEFPFLRQRQQHRCARIVFVNGMAVTRHALVLRFQVAQHLLMPGYG